MVYVAVRLAIFICAAAVVMNVVPGLRLAPYPYFGDPYTTLLAYGIVGIVFGTLHSFVRPIILFVSGRLYIRSLGLIAYLVDTFLFLIVTYLAPTVWQVGNARLFSAMLGAMLMGLIVAGLETLLGLGSPRAVEVRPSAFYWRWLGMLPERQRNQIVERLRTRQIISAIQSYLGDILVELSPLRGFRRFMQRAMYRLRPRLREDSPAVKLRLMLQDLGPTFVKFGQMAASRIELLPPAWRSELERLQDDVRPFPYSEVAQVITRELGRPPELLFTSFEQQPLGAASTGQVHAATLPQGEQVVVKVRRPSVDVIMAGDLNIMRDVITTLEQRLPWLQQFGVGALFKEFAENALRELDYTNEAFQGRVMRQNMQRLSFVQIPRSYSSYSTTAVLTQERVSGVKISQVEAIDAAGIEREPLALNFFRALLQQLLFDGFFHADLHPGNVWVNLETQRIVLLDMGMVGRLSRFDRLTFGQLLWALHERDSTLVMRVLVNVCQPAPGADLTQLRYAIERLINTYLLGDETSVDMAKLTNEMLALLVRYGLRLRQEFTLAFKSIGQGEAIMRMLLGDKPADYILEVAYTTLIAILKEQFAFKRLADTVAKPLLSDAIARGPGLVLAASALLSDFERGQSLLQLQSGALARQAAQFQQQVTRSVQRIVLAAALIGLLLGASLIFILPVEQYLSVAAAQVVRAIAAGSFALSAILLVVLALSALWQTFRAP